MIFECADQTLKIKLEAMITMQMADELIACGADLCSPNASIEKLLEIGFGSQSVAALGENAILIAKSKITNPFIHEAAEALQ